MRDYPLLPEPGPIRKGYHDFQLGQRSPGHLMNFLSEAWRFNEQKVWFVTTHGYIGVGPAATAIGDRVFILLGLQTPFLLRKEAETSHTAQTLIGPAYVHGLMYGEFMRTHPKTEVFALR